MRYLVCVLAVTAACSHSPAGAGSDKQASGSDASIVEDAGVLHDAGVVVTPPDAGIGAALDPFWFRESVGYEIFVRSFQDSDGDGIGDLNGITSRLDYLEELGVDLLWLMPINDGPSYHGYEVRDYREIETDYGTLADFDALIAAARARDMHVILDLVINHSSSEHRWFVEGSQNRDSIYRDYYVWSDHDPGWSAPWGGGSTWYPLDENWYYGIFWRGMPDLNYQNPALRAEVEQIASFWLDRGVDGFRLDAARYLIETSGGPGQADTAETHGYWREFRAAVNRSKPNALLVGEVWESTAIVVPYFGTPEAPELHMNFDFAGASGMLNAIRRGDAEPARLPLEERLRAYPSWATGGSFLANHDQFRVATVLANAGSDGGAAARKLAAALLLCWPGTPWIYYGEEIGMRHGEEGADDRLKRRPMQWTGGAGAGFSSGTPWLTPASVDEADSVRGQTAAADSLLSLYRKLIELRKTRPALLTGETRVLAAEGSASEPLVIVRELGAERLVLVYNFAAAVNDVRISGAASLPASLPASLRFRDLIGGASYARGDLGADLEISQLEPFGFRILLAD